MQFKDLATYFETIEQTSSRLVITETLGKLFKKLHADDIGKAIYLLQGRVAPLYEKIEFGMAEKMVINSIVMAMQLEKVAFVKDYQTIGDLGKAVEKYKNEVKALEERDPTINQVYKELHDIATAGGPGSQDVKVRALAHLIREIDPLSARYLVRIPTGTMRLGFSDMTILDALSWMLHGDKSSRPAIEKAYHVRPDLGFIAETLKTKGVEGMEQVKPHIYTPILMMRAERLASTEDIIKKLGECIVESKYDGFRLQMHYSRKKNEVRLYSRNLEEVAYMYPDLVEGIRKEAIADDLIIEGEAIGFDPHAGTFLPFQETVQRKRKHGIEEKAKEIPLKLFAFELLYADGVSYIQTPFKDRRKKLEKVIKRTGDIFKDTIIVAQENLVSDPKKLEIMFDDAISKGLEGIVAKKMDGVYQPGARGWNWIKFKRSYSSKIEDTIDCLIMGYDYGKGKRVDFGIGAFLVGIYDEKEDKFCTVAKIGTGLTDDEWRKLRDECNKYKSHTQPALYSVDKAMSVDAWVKPAIIVEIKADELTRSSVHTAGRIMKASKSGSAFDVDVPGYALRFPRLQKFRTDKRPEDVTTLHEVEKMFKDQKH